MKPLWTHTLAWVAAVLAAVVLALAGPDLSGLHYLFPHETMVLQPTHH
jgi:hypothetical protein